MAVACLSLALVTAACSDSTPTQPVDNTDQATDVSTTDTLRGFIKGTMVSNHTYYLWEDAVVPAGDTLLMEPGSRLICPRLNPADQSVYTLFVNGALLAEGTKDNMVYMGPGENMKYFGSWGGLQCDSPSVTSLKFVRLEYAGGLRPTGQPRPAIYFTSNAANTSRYVMEDCQVYASIDDGFQCRGGSGSILRNSFDMIGQNNGAAMNFKTGFHGTIAYNYLYNTLDHGIQVETSADVLFPQTDVTIVNNTFVNSGFRNPSRPGAGIIMNKFSRGKLYNNIFVNTREGIRITDAADVDNIEYGNNLFYTTVDSLKSSFYPSDAMGAARPSDLIDVDPMFTSYDGNISSQEDNTDPHLQSSSPAHGAGNATYDQDLGAFTSKR